MSARGAASERCPAMTAETSAPTDPVRKSVRVACDVEKAFRVFVEDIDRWWPVERLSRTADEQYAPGVTLERVVFEPRAGGRVYEVTSEGDHGSWAEVVSFEPPRRLVLAWKPNDRDEPPTEVDIRFEPDGDGTLVLLEHRGWERLGERAVEARQGHAEGWDLPLGRFAATLAG
jgi:uncharacterized protein YndB with AHSA1/START domain